MTAYKKLTHSIMWPLIISSALSVGLYLARVLTVHHLGYWYLVWNLFLAWIPLGLTYLLVRSLKTKSWLAPINILLTLLWLGFLPNSFYVLTDFIHLASSGEIGILYDVVMIFSFVWTSMLLGFMSLFLVHMQLRKRLGVRNSGVLVGLILVVSSFGIYLGRFLVWNTWDVLIHPGGIIIDISDRLLNPGTHPTTFTTTALFSVFLIVFYYAMYEWVRIIRGPRNN